MEFNQSSFCVAGIDVRKDRFNVHILPVDKCNHIARTTNGFKELFDKIADIQPAVAVMEAEAGDKIAVASVLAQSG